MIGVVGDACWWWNDCTSPPTPTTIITSEPEAKESVMLDDVGVGEYCWTVHVTKLMFLLHYYAQCLQRSVLGRGRVRAVARTSCVYCLLDLIVSLESGCVCVLGS